MTVKQRRSDKISICCFVEIVELLTRVVSETFSGAIRRVFDRSTFVAKIFDSRGEFPFQIN